MTDFNMVIELLDNNNNDYEITSCGSDTYVFIGKNYIVFDEKNMIKDVVRG